MTGHEQNHTSEETARIERVSCRTRDFEVGQKSRLQKSIGLLGVSIIIGLQPLQQRPSSTVLVPAMLRPCGAVRTSNRALLFSPAAPGGLSSDSRPKPKCFLSEEKQTACP